MKPFSILSVGGSIVVPDTIDTAFIRRFRTMIMGLVRRGHRFVIIVGGGQTNRTYNAAARKLTSRVSDADLDQLGIDITHVNAELLRIAFGRYASSTVYDDPHVPLKEKAPIVLAAGWKPGCSTDKDAVLWAQRLNAKNIINCTNIDSVSTADPKKDNHARPVHETTWAAYRTMIPKRWAPRLNTPFDPVAARLAERAGIRVAVVNGRRLDQVRNAILGKRFRGTVIA